MRVSLIIALATCLVLGVGPRARAAGDPGPAGGGSRLVPLVRSLAVPIGDGSVEIAVADTGTDMTFIRVHQNEMPAGAVGARINAEVPSRFIDLSHRGTREIAYALDGRPNSVDPNRIFSSGAPFEAPRPAAALADALTGLLLPNAPVLALHNNRGTLLQSYASGPFRTCAHAVYLNPLMTPSTFAVVSTRALFEAVRRLGINVVWENRAGANDDGSLLAYAQRHDLPYVNVEAAQGAAAETQLDVVRRIAGLLRGETAAPRRQARPPVSATGH